MCEREFPQFRTLWKNEKFFLTHQRNISSNQLFSNLFSKTVTFTKFLLKMREREFPQFPHCAVLLWNNIKFTFNEKIFREINSFAKILVSRNYYQKRARIKLPH